MDMLDHNKAIHTLSYWKQTHTDKKHNMLAGVSPFLELVKDY